MNRNRILRPIFEGRTKNWKSLDYVAGWFMKAADYGTKTQTGSAFVSTNSICQGQQVSVLWPIILSTGNEISFAHTSFKWANLASKNAGVTVAVVGISKKNGNMKRLYSTNDDGQLMVREAENINAYLVAAKNIYIEKRSSPAAPLPTMTFGNQPIDGGHFIVSRKEQVEIENFEPSLSRLVYRYLGSREFINGIDRRCLWINPEDEELAAQSPVIRKKIEGVARFRSESDRKETVEQARKPFQFVYRPHQDCRRIIIVPSASSERREYLPCGLLTAKTIVSNLAFALYDAPLWNMALIASRLHLVWIATVCGKLKTDFRYSNTLGWNTFPVPTLTEKNKADLTRVRGEHPPCS